MQKLSFPAPENDLLQPKVGVFDSGVGGLSVLAACARLLPQARFFYYGDNAHAPYGEMRTEEIARRVRRAMRAFRARRVNAAVIACNTATAACAEEMRAEFCFPVLGMEPAVAPAARACRNVLVLATPFTAQSARLHALLARFPDCRFTVAALPRLAAAVERYFACGKRLTLSDHLPRAACDGVVLGCTHYALFRDEIAAFYGVPVFDGAEGTARRLCHVLGVGTDDHLRPTQNPNKRFTKSCNKWGEKGVVFLGNGKKVNKYAYNSNICFTNF